jgi:membrane fusion protein (multidrug efflux system)
MHLNKPMGIRGRAVSVAEMRELLSRSADWCCAPILVGFFLVSGCNAQSPSTQTPAPPPPAVGTQLAQIRGISRTYSFVGRIKATNTVQLHARVEGFLENVLFTEGQDVKEGDLLYQIEKVQYQAMVEQSQANVAAAIAQQTNAQLTYNRSAELVKSQNVPQSTVDLNQATLDSAKATVLQNKAALTLVQLNLSYTDIMAPIAGRIGLTTYTKGNLVGPTSGVLATIVSQDPIYVTFPVSVRELDEIRASRKQEDGGLTKIAIFIRSSTGQEYSHPGVWNFTDTQVDQQTDTLLMRGVLPNAERQLVDGQFVTVEVRERKEQPRLIIPQAALQVDQAGSYVLVVGKDDKAELRRITTGPTQGADIVVDSGLREGEAVVVEGAQKIRPGQTVRATAVSQNGGG